ncbi:MAG: DUF3267 domain-containing protein [Bacillota bacterium]
MEPIRPGYVLADRWSVQHHMVEWVALGNVLLVLAVLLVGVGLPTMNSNAPGVFLPLSCIQQSGLTIWAIPLFLGVIVVHELAHGLSMRLISKEVRWGAGVRGGVPYAFVTTSAPLKRSEMMIVLLAPLTLGAVALGLSLLSSPCVTTWVGLAFIANTVGACGDVWMFISLLSYPSSALFYDHEQGTDIYVPEGARKVSSLPPQVLQFLSHLSAWWTLIIIIGSISLVLKDFLRNPQSLPTDRFVTVETVANGVIINASGLLGVLGGFVMIAVISYTVARLSMNGRALPPGGTGD